MDNACGCWCECGRAAAVRVIDGDGIELEVCAECRRDHMGEYAQPLDGTLE